MSIMERPPSSTGFSSNPARAAEGSPTRGPITGSRAFEVPHDAAKAQDSVDSAGIVVKILGIVTRTHDSGLALLDDGVATIVLEEERFNREKHTTKIPVPLPRGGI